jgi:hypothetical protein
MKTIAVGVGRVLLISSSVLLAAAGCSRSADSKNGNKPSAQSAENSTPTAPILVRGSVASISTDLLVLKSDTGLVTVRLVQPFRLYDRVPSDLAHVKESSFIGVTTVKQADGSERATEIHVFPEELRGLGEGSRMMAPDTTAVASRMTNGNVASARMTNGTASQSRMSNGSVSSTKGPTLVVQYAGGSQTVTVPSNTPVTEFRVASKGLVVGARLIVLAAKAADGSLTADKALSTAK